MVGRRILGFVLAVGVFSCSSEETHSASQPLSGVSTSADGGSSGSTTGQGGETGSGGNSTSSSTTTGSGGDGATGGGDCGGSDATIETVGTDGTILLRGTIVTLSDVFAGEVLVSGDEITCVDVSCDNSGATIIETNGYIFPGLIDPHNHILFDIFDESDWSPSQSYTNHNQWTEEEQYGAMLDAKQYLNGEDSDVDFGCELDKYGEIKGMISGTTSILGAAGTSKNCFKSLVRTIDLSANDLDDDKIQTSISVPSSSSADGVCENFDDGDTNAYVVHIAEGVDDTAHDEFDDLYAASSTDGCLFASKTTIVHGTALDDSDFSTMATNGMSLVWSPRSNVFLYGAGTDLSMTADIPSAISYGINIALGPDWSIGGSQNLLDELRFADEVDNEIWGDVISAEMLVEMVTINAAKALGLEDTLGSIEVGKKADLMVVQNTNSNAYESLLAATPREVMLVMVGGKILYGDVELQEMGANASQCEEIEICCRSKFMCIAEEESDDKLNQTFSEIETTLSAALSDYDAMDLSEWNFSPLAELVKCE